MDTSHHLHRICSAFHASTAYPLAESYLLPGLICIHQSATRLSDGLSCPDVTYMHNPTHHVHTSSSNISKKCEGDSCLCSFPIIKVSQSAERDEVSSTVSATLKIHASGESDGLLKIILVSKGFGELGEETPAYLLNDYRVHINISLFVVKNVRYANKL